MGSLDLECIAENLKNKKKFEKFEKSNFFLKIFENLKNPIGWDCVHDSLSITYTWPVSERWIG